MTDTNEANPQMIACSDDVIKALAPLLHKHDVRLMFACLMAESAHTGAMIKCANIYTTETIARLFNEAMLVALTLDVKPKIMYTDHSGDKGGLQ